MLSNVADARVPPEPGRRLSLDAVGRGQPIIVHGSQYFGECRDTVEAGRPVPPRGPAGAVLLTLVTADGRRRPLAAVHPDADGRFRAVVRIPVSAPAGPATLRDAEGHVLDLILE